MRRSTASSLRGMLRRVNQWAGLAFTLLLIGWGSITVLLFMYVPLFSRKPSLLDGFLASVAAVTFLMTMWSLGVLFVTHPGPPPPWFAAERVEAFMRGLLADVVAYGSSGGKQGEGKRGVSGTAHHSLTAAEGHKWLDAPRGAQEVVAGTHEMQLVNNSACYNAPTVALDFVRDAGAAPKQEEKRQQQQEVGGVGRSRRRRRRDGVDGSDVRSSSNRLWMPHRNIFLVASDGIAALDRSPESREQEMCFLIGGARRCRFCHIYKLDDTHHCSRCRTCVYGMDHHCPWIGQCIGYDNHKHFLLFMGYIILLLATSLLHFVVVVSTGRASFILAGASAMLLLALVLAGSFLVVLLAFCARDVFLLGRGDSTLRLLRREERRAYESLHRGSYNYVTDDASDSGDGVAVRRFSFQNLRRVFGAGPVCPLWFLPLQPQRPSPSSEEAEFWAALKLTALRQMREVADAEDDSSDSDEENVERGGGGSGVRRL
ncbi:putative zinc-binding protein [Trypanosoma conorhini]|uniref:Palmitoyltransferase n=1 Tax=Trypanosoma conorhini TaxID=83891 RepID=A0A3R7NDE1_9TRYP|nr:putative zinc-binding protein [Trypanosoma conorhini]RNF20503.1 putative zinc-binding protein [Trypanosoma conorhini]